MNNALNKLEILIDKGLVNLDVGDTDTEDEAIADALQELQENEAETAKQVRRQRRELELTEQEMSGSNYSEGGESEPDEGFEETPEEDFGSQRVTLKTNEIMLNFDPSEEEDDAEHLYDMDDNNKTPKKWRRDSEYNALSPSPLSKKKNLGSKNGEVNGNSTKSSKTGNLEQNFPTGGEQTAGYVPLAARRSRDAGNKKISK